MKLFTVDEANQLLPFLHEKLTILQQIQKEFFQTYKALQYHRSSLDTSSEHRAEIEGDLFKLECQLEFMQIEFDMHFNSITSQGVQVKDVDLGLVDFPAIYEENEVLLCWIMGEETVSHYHTHHEGFNGRKKIF